MELSYISLRLLIFWDMENLKNSLYFKKELLYILGWNFIALRLTNFWREVPSSYFFYIYFGKWNVLSPRLNKFLFQSELSKPTLIALAWKKKFLQ